MCVVWLLLLVLCAVCCVFVALAYAECCASEKALYVRTSDGVGALGVWSHPSDPCDSATSGRRTFFTGE